MKGNAISALVNKDIIIFIVTKKYVVSGFPLFVISCWFSSYGKHKVRKS